MDVDRDAIVQTDVMTPEERASADAKTLLEREKRRAGERVVSSLCDGTIVGKYRIVRQLGQGGQGKVFLAEDIELGREVALKTVTAGALFTESALKRFRNEARAVANLRSPNIVQLYEVFEADGVPFLAMEYVEGETLLSRCNKGGLSHRDVVEIIAECCEAMGQAHRCGLIHRDLKPQNVMLTRNGEPKVMDFGLAKSILTDPGYCSATLEGQVIGSPAYMSPEQASGDRGAVGPRSDVFALGTTLYQCLSRKLPHAADTPMETIFRVIHEEPKPLTSIDPTINEDLNAVCLMALEKSPKRRYADAAEFGADLRRWLRNEPVVARPSGMAQRVGKAFKRNSDVAVVSGVAATFLAVTISASLWLFASQSAKQVSGGVQAELKSVANTAALMFAASEMDQIMLRPEDRENTFRTVVLRLNEVRHRNPRIENVYLFRRPLSEDRLLYVADADAFLRKGGGFFRVGYEWVPSEGSLAKDGFTAPAVDAVPIAPGWGERWTGYAPVTDRDGNTVGLLAVEMGAKEIKSNMQPVVRTTIQVGGIAALLFLGFTGVAGFRVMRGRKKFI
jgi:predicted Ser/Thr protein kinase